MPFPEDNPRWIVYRGSFWESGAISQVLLQYGSAVTHCNREYTEVLEVHEFEGEEFSYLSGYGSTNHLPVQVQHGFFQATNGKWIHRKEALNHAYCEGVFPVTFTQRIQPDGLREALYYCLPIGNT